MVDLPAADDGLRHYMTKGDKVEWLTGRPSKARKAEMLEAARASRTEHHERLAERRRKGPLDKASAIEALLSGHLWKYDGQHRPAGGFRDAATGRKANVAYVLVETNTGERHEVTRATLLDAYDRLGIVRGWPIPRGRPYPVGREAAKTGMVTASGVV